MRHLISHQKNEALKFVKDIKYSFLNIENDDHIWTQILQNVDDCDFQRNHYLQGMPTISDEAPFIQGDGLEEGLPDIIYEADDYVIGIEHFQFDSSTKTSKGSKMIQADVQAHREIEWKIRNVKMKPCRVEVSVAVRLSYEWYVKSLLCGFNDHAKNIAKYKGALKQKYPDKKILLAFYIEDVTAIGNYITTSNGGEAMNPLCVKEFLTELQKYADIDYILTRTQDSYVYSLRIQRIDTKTIQSLLKKSYNENDRFIQYSYAISSNVHDFSKDSSDCRKI